MSYELLRMMSVRFRKPPPDKIEFIDRIHKWLDVLMTFDFEYEHTKIAEVYCNQLVMTPGLYEKIPKGIRPFRLALIIIYRVCEENKPKKLPFNLTKFEQLIRIKLNDPNVKLERITIKRDYEKFLKECP